MAYLSVYACIILTRGGIIFALASHSAPFISALFGSSSPKSWKALLAAVSPDTSPLPPRFYRPAMMALGTVHFIVGSAVAIQILAFVGGKPSRMQEVA